MSKGVELTHDSPFSHRLRAYCAERFPLLGHGVLILSYYSSNSFLAHALTEPGRPMQYSARSLVGGLTLFCFFLHLRIFDEHKDYTEDCCHYPDRVLQRGLITLRHLKLLGAAAICAQLLLCAAAGAAALTAWTAAFGFSLLMLKEFFVGDWLKRHFLLYAGSHMLIMPLLALLVFSSATARWPWTAPPWFWVYAFVGFFVTCNWEISRKIRAPEDEIEGVDSYSRIFGAGGAAWMVLAVRLIDTAMVAAVGAHLGLSPWFMLVLAALFAICLTGFIQFRRHPSAATAKRMETYAGMYIVAFDLALAVELVRRNGLEFVLWPTRHM